MLVLQMYPGVQYLNGAQQVNVNGQVVTATNWFPAPTQTTGDELLAEKYEMTVSTNERQRHIKYQWLGH